jgi:hypothetical protein
MKERYSAEITVTTDIHFGEYPSIRITDDGIPIYSITPIHSKQFNSSFQDDFDFACLVSHGLNELEKE